MIQERSLHNSFSKEKPSGHMLPVVIISMSRWDSDFSSAAWSVAQTLAVDQTVIYVDYPYTRTDYRREKNQPSVLHRRKALLAEESGLVHRRTISPWLYTLTPPLMMPVNRLPALLRKPLQTRNDHRLAACILHALEELGQYDFIFLNSFNPLYLTTLPDFFRPAVQLYQSRDDIRGLEPYLRKHGEAGEIEAIQNADISFATSLELKRTLTERSGKEVRYLPNAADFELFKAAFKSDSAPPDDLVSIPKPRIGFTGNICHRMDYKLLEHLCSQHTDKSIVMVGPRNHYGHTDIDLDAIPNLYFTGPKQLRELPRYLAHFDLLILPFLKNRLTSSIYPLKINEYLASGKPVVSTGFSEDIRSFDDVVKLANTPAAFSDAITQELVNDTPEKALKRHDRASENTWEKRVALLRDWINEVLSQKLSEKFKQ